jgi:3-hydroxyacyl-CoA dehydrogenase/enoyl-CoA hydratase/3-hydroxybutyryl-CoA epimerase
MTMRSAAVAAQTQHNYPAPIAILACVFEGTLMPFDKALRLESKHFAKLLCGSVARNLIRTTFLNKAEAGKLARRPPGIPNFRVNKLGVLGAGMMGASIAYVAAGAGIEVVLLDRELLIAEKGRGYSQGLLAKEVQRGKKTQGEADAWLARIVPTADYSMLQGCDLVIEAVFEDAAVKADATRKSEAVIPERSIFSSNTSTLPISELGAASKRPAQFIGLHFF